ncbi:MAG: transcriptional regulator [Peptoniphilaceae bacterium]|nr:transcriptional regulator [Peptoniphilaceae bacterium]
MTDERKEFGKKLIEIRERKGLRQADVAEIANLSQRSIGRLERGEIESASVDSLIELSKAYGIDVLSLYKKYIYGNLCILEDIKKSLDINAIFLSKEIRTTLLDKINLIKDSRDLQAKRYEIDLLELFIRYLNAEVSDEYLKNHFEDLSSSKINRENFYTIDLSPIELRILLNIATSSKSFKNIDSLEILEKCKNQNKDFMIKIASCNNLANFYKYYGNFNKTIETINEGLELSSELSSIDGLIYLNFVKFITLYRANENYEKSLHSTIIFSKYSKNLKLSMAINEKINKIIYKP